MKYLKYLLLLLLVMPMFVFAKGSVKVSTTSINVTKGSSASFKITASNAAGKIDVKSTDSSVASISASSFWIENESVTITVKALKVGTTKITVSLSDVATFDEEVLTGTYTVNVNVKEKENKPQPKEEVADSKLLSTAKLLVEASEKSLAKDDYDAAIEYTMQLNDSDSKNELLERLEIVKNKIDNQSETEEEETDTCECENNCEDCLKNNKLYIILIILLFALSILEGSYLTYLLVLKGRE